MPHMSHNTYLDRHAFLAHAWEHYPTLLAMVGPAEQRDLHRYYPTTHDHDELALSRHRKEVSKDDPSLPHRTGRSFTLVYQTFCRAYEFSGGEELRFHQAIAALASSHVPGSGKTLAILRPEIDLGQLADALVKLARHEATSQDAA